MGECGDPFVLSPQSPHTAKSHYVGCGLSSPLHYLCCSLWKSFSYLSSCLAGFLHYQCEFFSSSDPYISCAFLMDHWTYCPLLCMLTNFSSRCYVGNASLYSSSFTFPPSGSQGRENRVLLVVLVQFNCFVLGHYCKGERRAWAGGAGNPCLISQHPWLRKWGVSEVHYDSDSCGGKRDISGNWKLVVVKSNWKVDKKK